jgi:hypothetical protein
MMELHSVGAFARRHSAFAAVVFAALCLSSACGTDAEQGSEQFGVSAAQPGPVGLYTPGNTLGKSDATNGTDGGFTDLEISTAMLRDSTSGAQTCAAPPADLGMTKEMSDAARATGQDLAARARTQGSLTLTFKTKQPGGRWRPGNVGAVWVEDIQQRPVRRLQQWAGERLGCLAFYLSKTCSKYMDVVATATLADHLTPHNVTWDGKDFLGNVVPDGQYVIWIEVADVERVFGPRTTFPFAKGTQPTAMSIPDAPATTGLEFNYTPVLSNTSGDTKP